MIGRTSAPAFILIVVVAVLCLVVHLGQRFTGPLELNQRYGNYGGANFSTGSREYPRVVDDTEGYALKIARPTRTIASQYWSLDEFVYSIAPPESVVAVSEYAFQHDYSNVFKWADLFHPAVAADPEIILKLDPDLLLVSSEARADFTNVLRVAGTPTFRAFTSFTKLSEIPSTIRLIGYATGRDSEAETLAMNFESAVKHAESRKPASMRPPRVLGFAGKFSYGDETMFDDVIRTLGGINVAAENGLHGYTSLNSEQIVKWNPDWILAGANRGQTQTAARQLLNDPAVALTAAAQNGRVLVLENNVFMPMSPYTTLVLKAVGDALYGPESESGQ
jgi:iron complex transport system substrate-binding protein